MSERPDDDYPTVTNEERGCGFLEYDKGYLRSPPASASGHLPAFVWFDPPVPYHERDKFRGYEFFPGIQFELAVTGELGKFEGPLYSPSGSQPDFKTPEEVEEESPHGVGEGDDSLAETDPCGEIHRHISRCVSTPADGSHAGDIAAFRSHDLYMHIGASYYETPEEFVEEVKRQGLSKAIPVSESNRPPRIDPGKTRLFLVHPHGTGDPRVADGTAAVIGYVYLHRTIYTETTTGEHPAWAKETARARSDFEPVHIGNKIYSDGTAATIEGSDWAEKSAKDTEDDRDTEESEREAAIRNLPVRLVPSEEDGRDVQAVPVDDSEAEADTDDQTEESADSPDRETRDASQTPDADEEDEAAEAEADGTKYLTADSETFETVAGPFEDYVTAQQSAAGSEVEVESTPRTELLHVGAVEVHRPGDCPDCSAEVKVDSMQTEDYGPVEVRECSRCPWDNSTAVKKRLTELDLRTRDYNSLRRLASDRGLSLQNPQKDDLIAALLDTWTRDK